MSVLLPGLNNCATRAGRGMAQRLQGRNLLNIGRVGRKLGRRAVLEQGNTAAKRHRQSGHPVARYALRKNRRFWPVSGGSGRLRLLATLYLCPGHNGADRRFLVPFRGVPVITERLKCVIFGAPS